MRNYSQTRWISQTVNRFSQRLCPQLLPVWPVASVAAWGGSSAGIRKTGAE